MSLERSWKNTTTGNPSIAIPEGFCAKTMKDGFYLFGELFQDGKDEEMHMIGIQVENKYEGVPFAARFYPSQSFIKRYSLR